MRLSLVDVFYSVATGSRRRRLIMTPVGLIIFFGLLWLVVVGSARLDGALGLPALLPGVPGLAIGWGLIAVGVMLWIWCLVWFRRVGGGGTPVPFNPPPRLVTAGPYAWVRNPMLSGVFAFMFGLGFILHSVSMVFLWTPLFVVINVIELKKVEEPELERRFGTSYGDYKRRVPMFVPRPPGKEEENAT